MFFSGHAHQIPIFAYHPKIGLKITLRPISSKTQNVFLISDFMKRSGERLDSQPNRVKSSHFITNDGTIDAAGRNSRLS